MRGKHTDADAPPSFVNRVPFVVPSALVIDLHMCLVSNHFDGAGFFCSSFNLEIGEKSSHRKVLMPREVHGHQLRYFAALKFFELAFIASIFKGHQ